MKNREEFDFLGGALPPPFDEASASDVATAIHAVLVDVGLTRKSNSQSRLCPAGREPGHGASL